jgi:hypothetical protein
MTDDELVLFNALSEQADNKVSVFVQESTPSWTDADANHDDDRWYKPSERTWYRYFSNLSPPWRVADQSILNIEDYAKEKTTYHYGTAYPPSDLGEIDDFYLRDYDGLIIQYRKTGGTTWVEASRFSNGATVGMTDDELALFNALSEQADNKVSVYVQPSTSVPSWTDSNDNHVDDEWYQTDTKKWFRFTNTILGWVENDDSIYNIEALANGKTTVHYITALADLTDPENDLSSAPDGDYCIYESGDDRKYFKRASGSWVLSSEMTNGADATKTVIEGGLVTTGSIQSNNFGSSAGMKIDLTNATIIIREAEGLLIESVGGVTVSDSGGVTVEEGGDIVLETSDGDYIFCGQDVSISGFSTYGGLVIYPDNWPSGVAYPSPYLSLGLSGDGFGVVAMYAGSSLHLFTGTAVYTDNEADLGKSASPWGNVYITGSVIDSCEGFAGDALAELAKIKTEPSKDSWQKVIHDELPESVKHIEQVNRFIDKKTGQAYDRKDPARGGDFVEESYNVVRRNLTRQIMLNTRAIMQLNEKMEAMDARS